MPILFYSMLINVNSHRGLTSQEVVAEIYKNETIKYHV